VTATVAIPSRGAVHRNQTERSYGRAAWSGSPGSRVAPLKLPTVLPTRPVRFDAAAKASLAGAAAMRHVLRAATVSAPAAFAPLTSKVWVPTANPAYDLGEVQATNGEPSRLHWNVAGFDEPNDNEASLVATTPEGPAEILVYGESLETEGGSRTYRST
jgi:hypothetical protein